MSTCLFSLDQGKINPTEQVIHKNGYAKFVCRSSKPVRWSYQHGITPTNVDYQGNNIIISQVGRINQGYYECHGMEKNGNTFVAKGLLYVRGECF